MTSTTKERDDLLLEIAHCQTKHDLLADRRAEHSCARIVHDQRPRENGHTQLPEPWNGNLGAAPLLFVSSNPSISRQERYPETSWPLQDVSEFFYHRFGDSPAAPIQGGCKVLNKDGSRSKAVPFLSWARGRAAELGLTVPESTPPSPKLSTANPKSKWVSPRHYPIAQARTRGAYLKRRARRSSCSWAHMRRTPRTNSSSLRGLLPFKDPFHCAGNRAWWLSCRTPTLT